MFVIRSDSLITCQLQMSLEPAMIIPDSRDSKRDARRIDSRRDVRVDDLQYSRQESLAICGIWQTVLRKSEARRGYGG